MDQTVKFMRIFAKVAELGSFTKAADALKLPKASVSLGIGKLEAHLGVRLLHRTTRSVSLTNDGQSYLERCEVLLSDLEEIDRLFHKDKSQLKGRLRVDVPSRIARRLLIPQLPHFFQAYPEISLDLGSTDQLVDLAKDGVDCVVRVGQLKESSLVVRPLGNLKISNCASPSYLKKHGHPKTLEDLSRHLLVDYYSPKPESQSRFEYEINGELNTLPMKAMLRVGNAESYIAGALAGLGIIQVPSYDISEHLAEGALTEVLKDFTSPSLPISFLYPHRRHLSQRVNVFMDWASKILEPQTTGRKKK